MACSAYGAEPVFGRIKRLKIYQSQGSLIQKPPVNLESRQRLAKGLASKLNKVNHRQALSGLTVRGEEASYRERQSQEMGPEQSRRRRVSTLAQTDGLWSASFDMSLQMNR
jgi:hypothetical protein